MLPQVRLRRGAGKPLHQQLSDELRRLILSGDLKPGSRLPPTRRASKEWGISRNLVVLAYEQLQLEGYLQSAVGVGTWVPESLAAHLLQPAATSAPSRDRGDVGPRGLSRRGERLAGRHSPISATRPTLPFRPAAVAADMFPVRTWRQLTGRSWKARSTELVHYGDVQGHEQLRAALADHLVRYRGVRVSADRIVVTTGSQQSLDLVARMLLDPGDRAAIEEPGYDGAIASFSAVGAELVPVPVDGAGLDLDAARLPEDVRLLYTTPSHQYPLGVTLSLDRRLGLLQWARRTGSWIFEDDYDSEFRYESRPLPSLQGLDRSGRVIYVGTFSKVLASGLRIGFIVLPEDLVGPFVKARQVTDHHPALGIQVPLAEFIAEGHLERHIVRMRAVYAERRQALLEAIEDILGSAFEVVSDDGGLHVTLLLPDGLADRDVAKRGFHRGIDPQPLSAHYLGPDRRQGLVLGFGGFPPEQLRSAVRILLRCIEESGQGAPREPRGAT